MIFFQVQISWEVTGFCNGGELLDLTKLELADASE